MTEDEAVQALGKAFDRVMPSFKEKMVDDLTEAMKFGASTERAAIVAWLRGWAPYNEDARKFAIAIERGAHTQGLHLSPHMSREE